MTLKASGPGVEGTRVSVFAPPPSRRPPLSSRFGWDGDRAVLELAGELDLATLPVAERALTQAQVDGARRLVLDLGDVSFLDLSGLRLIFDAHDRWGSGLEVVRGAGPVHDVLVFSGLASKLAFTPPRRRFRRADRQPFGTT
jgi:anti-anti-sigma factor